MGHKINLNIKDELAREVIPILKKWDEKHGGHSEQVCEAIIFYNEARTSKIWDAIMQYDRDRAKSEEKEMGKHLGKINDMLFWGDGDPYHYLTEDQSGPRLPPAHARQEIRSMKESMKDEISGEIEW